MSDVTIDNLIPLFSEQSGLDETTAERLIDVALDELKDLIVLENGAKFEYFGRFRVGAEESNYDRSGKSDSNNGSSPSSNSPHSPPTGSDTFSDRVVLPSPRKDKFLEDMQAASTEEQHETPSVYKRWFDKIVKKDLLKQDDAFSCWKNLVSTFENILQNDNDLKLEGVGAFHVTTVEDADGPNPTVQFDPSSSLLEDLEDDQIHFSPERRILSFLASSLRDNEDYLLFVVPEDDFFFETFRNQFEDLGYRVQFEEDSERALELINTDRKAICVVDTRLNSTSEFVKQVKKGISTYTCVQVIQIFSENEDPDRPDKFLVEGDAKIQEPFDVDELKEAVNRAKEKLIQPEGIFEQRIRYVFPTKEEILEESHKYTESLIDQSDLPSTEKLKLRAAFREAIGNAAQHGNHFRRDRMIHCSYLYDSDRISFKVTDEGDGFDHKKFVERGQTEEAIDMTREGHKEGKYGGFGIMLMLRTVDDLEYNEKGNTLKLTDYHSNLPMDSVETSDAAG